MIRSRIDVEHGGTTGSVQISFTTLLLVAIAAAFGVISCARSDSSIPDMLGESGIESDQNVVAGTEQDVELVVEDRAVELSTAFEYGPRLLEQEIFYADAIIRARFVSARAGYRTVTRNSFGLNYTDPAVRYAPTVIFELDVLEYLKGSGTSTVSMTGGNAYGPDGVLFSTEEEALEHARGMLAHRHREYDHRDLILFLPTSETPYDWIIYSLPPNDSATGASDESDYLGWLTSAMPAITEDVAVGTSSELHIFDTGNVEDFRSLVGRLFVPDPNGPQGATGATTVQGQMTVSELRWWIAEVGKLETKAKNDPNFPSFARCLAESWLITRERNARPDGDAPILVAMEIDSGLPAGSALFGGESLGAAAAEAPTQWLTGTAAHLFEAQHIDDDDDRRTGYESRTVVTRPIPAGTYEVGWGYSLPEFALCGLPQEQVRELWMITAVTTPDVVHEAFFDPGEAENGEAGYDYEGIGVLSPETFELPRNGGKMAVDRIVWYDDAVEVEFEPHVDLSLYQMDIIELDGTKSLTLPFGSATVRGHDDSRSYTWDHCEQPWHAGDMLMIRIREAGATGAVGPAVYPRECQPSGATGQDAPETAPTPTSESEETEATPESDEMPEGAAGSEADPSAPQILDAEEEGKSVELAWAAPESHVGEIVGYRIYRASPDDADLAVIVEDTGSTETSHLDDTLDYGTTYRYAVAALLVDGSESNRSATISVTTNDFVAEE